MRLATYNVEWFSALFDQNNRLINDNSWSRRRDVTKSQQITALGKVFRALDADAIMVIEAPDTGRHQSGVAALEHFARHFDLRQNKALIGFENDTQQEIALLYDPTKISARHDPQGQESQAENSPVAPRFDGVFRLDLNVDNQPDTVTFSKPPLEVALTPKGAKPMRLIGVHAKSKAPHGARNKREAVRISIDNRRKQLAQCIWLRQRVDGHLAKGEPLIVLGDFNDGPGLDEYEELFGRSGVEIVLGSDKPRSQQLFDPHAKALMAPRTAAIPTSSRFYNHRDDTYLNAMLDYVMLSADLNATTKPRWRIWHPFNDPACFHNAKLCKALLTASDHFPVSVDMEPEAETVS